MVRASDGPTALASLRSIAKLQAPAGAALQRLVLLNEEPNDGFAADLASAVEGEVLCSGVPLGVAGGRNMLVREAKRRGATTVLSIDDDILAPADFLQRLWDAREEIAVAGARPGVITPATLDFGRVADRLFGVEALAALRIGGEAPLPDTRGVLARLAESGGLDAADIYHMGIADWRGGYWFADTKTDLAVMRRYGIEPPRLLGASASLKFVAGMSDLIAAESSPVPIDTAPGGVCLYDVEVFDAVGGIDTFFSPFGFEDADFALRTNAAGFAHFCVPSAVAIHDIAQRLNDRPAAAIKATQGKALGRFARRHMAPPEAAAALISFSWRVLDDLGARQRTAKEKRADDGAVSRLAALAAYGGNLLAALLPDRVEGDLTTLTQKIGQLIFPDSKAFWVDLDGGQKRLEIAAPGANSLVVRLVPEATGWRLHVDQFALDLSRQWLSSMLRHILRDNNMRLTASGELYLSDEGNLIAENCRVRLHSGFSLKFSVRGKRAASESSNFVALNVSILEFELQDEGALPGLTHFLARLENLSVASFIDALLESDDPSAEALRSFLRGETDVLAGAASGSVDGAPAALNWQVRLMPGAHAGPNGGQQWLIAKNALPYQGFGSPAAASVPAEKLTSRVIGRVRRALADDPATIPFPDAYKPARTVRLVRKARYMAAGRGVALTPNEARITRYRDSGKDQRAFIIGNGPSLNALDLRKLQSETTFGANAIYLNRDNMGFLPTHYIVEDVFVAEDRASEINALSGPVKWFGNYLRYCLTGAAKTCWLNVACDYSKYPDFPHFSTNAARIVWVGGTVSFIAMQLAFFMGFKDVYLIGFDHSYSVPKTAQIDGKAITSTGDDPNHFHPDYFGKGYRWHDPQVERMELAYQKARRVFAAHGRRIRNATAGGCLEVFDRVDYQDLF